MSYISFWSYFCKRNNLVKRSPSLSTPENFFFSLLKRRRKARNNTVGLRKENDIEFLSCDVKWHLDYKAVLQPILWNPESQNSTESQHKCFLKLYWQQMRICKKESPAQKGRKIQASQPHLSPQEGHDLSKWIYQGQIMPDQPKSFLWWGDLCWGQGEGLRCCVPCL